MTASTVERLRKSRANQRLTIRNWASSTAGSDRLNQCCKKYILSMISKPFGGRPLPAFG